MRSISLVAAAAAAIAVSVPYQPVVAQQSTAIEEIVVTARKREEGLQSVPIAVSAITQQEIQSSFYRDAKDLEGMAPNLVIDPVGAGPQGAALSIRGISFSDIEKSFDPAVGILLDGIYIGTNTSQLFNVFDTERIEIARGPQGTLFGRNTIGGTISVVRTPVDLEGGVTARLQTTFASYDRRDYNALIQIPLIQDTLGLKLSGLRRTGGGEWRRNLFDGSKSDGEDYGTFLASLRWRPMENFDVTYTYQNEKAHTDTPPIYNMSRPLIGPPGSSPPVEIQCVAFGFCQQDPSTPDTGRLDRYSQNFPNEAELDGDYHTLRAEWGPTEDHTVTVLFGYRDQPEVVYQDFDAVAADIFSTRRDQDYEQTSLDVQLTSMWNERLTTTAGLFLWNSEYRLRQDTYFLFGTFTDTNTSVFQDTLHETDSFAIYFEGDYDVTDTVTVTLGGRWTRDDKKIDTTFGAIKAFDTIVVPGQNVQRKDDWDEFTPNARVRYQVNPDHMVYGSYSRGFRSGGFNGRAASETSVGPYDPETVDSFEAGWRSSWLEGSVIFNATAFHALYDDKQEEITRAAPPPVNQETVVTNAAKVKISGLELETIARPTPELHLRANYGFVNARYDKFTGADPLDPSQEVDLSFLDLRRAPKHTLGVGARYDLMIGDVGLQLTADARWKDDFHTNARNIEEGLIDSHWIVDASIMADFRWFQVRLFGRNLTDEQFVTSALDVGGGITQGRTLLPAFWTFSGVTLPRTYGLELTVDTGNWPR
jgi:iron complex outermembrane recepter protein